jgi:light-harvesting protein B-800-850 alpha chain
MNNAKMWLVVPPAVGVPIFLGAVAVGSFAVHIAVLSKTNWYSDYLVGEELGAGVEEASLKLDDGTLSNASFAMENADGTQQVLVILPDGSTTTALMKMPTVTKASGNAPPLVIEQ